MAILLESTFTGGFNPLFVVPATASPIISKEAHLKLSAQKKLYVYDIPTKRGQVINLYVDR